MREFQVGICIKRPQAEVFALISDHERFVSAPRAQCRLLQPGKHERNGEGAIREVRIDAGRIVERITKFDPPNMFEFEVLEQTGPHGKRMPLASACGRISFKETSEGTQVEWYQNMAYDIPVIGHLGERMAASFAGRWFRRFLDQAKQELESSAPR